MPLPYSESSSDSSYQNLLLMDLEQAPVTCQQVRLSSRRDPLISKVLQFTQTSWPKEVEPDLQPYSNRRLELSVEEGCLLWGSRVVIPPQKRAHVLEQLHQCHPGTNRMKALARSYFWWPKLDMDIENLVKACGSCQLSQKTPCKAPIHPWEWSTSTWTRLHIDYAWPYHGQMFLIVVDSFSKWLEVIPTANSTSTTTINKLRHLFSIHGLPQIIVSDNGTCFTSDEFRQFMENNGVRHIKSAPYHPATNGLAERAVQTFKRTL